MKIGRDTGSLVNWVVGNSKSAEPEIGMGVTFLDWTDRSPGTIVEIRPDGKIGVQADNYVRTDKNGFSEQQTYDYTPNPEAPVCYFQKDKDGRWEGTQFNPATKRWKKNSQRISVGFREKYHDFSF